MFVHSILLSFAAPTTTPPVPREPLLSLFSVDDYPAEAIREGEEGTVEARLEIAADGSVAGCDVERSSGSVRLDTLTCSILRERASFVPARNAQGRNMGATVATGPIAWRVERLDEGQEPDADLTGIVARVVRRTETGSTSLIHSYKIEAGRIVDCVAWHPNAEGGIDVRECAPGEWDIGPLPEDEAYLTRWTLEGSPLFVTEFVEREFPDARLVGDARYAMQIESGQVKACNPVSDDARRAGCASVPARIGCAGNAAMMRRPYCTATYERRDVRLVGADARALAAFAQLRAANEENPLVGLAVPQGDVRGIFKAEDYPAEAQRQGHGGTVRARLTVDPAGRVSACETVQSSGHASLDERTCAVMIERARFDPATQPDGTPMAGEYITPPITWRVQQIHHNFENPYTSFTYRADGSLDECVETLVRKDSIDVRACSEAAIRSGERIGRDYAEDPQLSQMVWNVWDLFGPREWLDAAPERYLPGARIMRHQVYKVTIAEGKLTDCGLVDFAPSWNDEERCTDSKRPWICVDRGLKTAICDNTTFYRTLLARRPINEQSREPFSLLAAKAPEQP